MIGAKRPRIGFRSEVNLAMRRSLASFRDLEEENLITADMFYSPNSL